MMVDVHFGQLTFWTGGGGTIAVHFRLGQGKTTNNPNARVSNPPLRIRRRAHYRDLFPAVGLKVNV